MILHTVNKSPFQHQCLWECLRATAPGDALLLIEDGVYASQEGTPAAAQIAQHQEDLLCYVLEEDLRMRGLRHTAPSMQRIGYPGFVELALRYDKVISWF